MNIVAVIPARMGSSRFPGKPMADILGMPMIGHCYKRAEMSELIDFVYVATCDKEIYDYDVDLSKTYTHNEKIELGYIKAKHDRLKDYKKPIECLKCKYFYICDGIENQLDMKVYPEKGKKIKDVNYYRKNFYK